MNEIKAFLLWRKKIIMSFSIEIIDARSILKLVLLYYIQQSFDCLLWRQQFAFVIVSTIVLVDQRIIIVDLLLHVSVNWPRLIVEDSQVGLLKRQTAK